MGRKATIDSTALIQALTTVFRNVGYEATSLNRLEKATGLKKASLYHRFPGGKEQMAEEVLTHSGAWLADHLVTPMKAEDSPQKRLRLLKKALNELYDGGTQSCLLNVMSTPDDVDSPFKTAIEQGLLAIRDAFKTLATDAGLSAKEAKARADQALMMMQGSLVVSRGLQTTRPFKSFLAWLDEGLIGQG